MHDQLGKRMLLKYRVVLLLLVFLAVLLVSASFYWSSSSTTLPNPLPLDLDDAVYVWPPEYNPQMITNSLSKMNCTLEDLPDRASLWTNKVQLCIMFNLNRVKPEKKTIDLLISYYYPFFKDILLIFDGNWTNRRPSFVPRFVDVTGCDSHLGWYQQRCIRKCIQHGSSDMDGYMYVADDMFINITKMAHLPMSKVWFIKMGVNSWSWIQNPGPKGWGWYWWGPPTNGAKKLKKMLESFPIEWKELLKKNAGFPDKFKSVSTSDIIYIPRGVVPKITPVFDHMINSGQLFCEIATGLAVNIAAPDRIELDGGYLWGDRGIPGIKRKAVTAHFVHPIKLGNKIKADLWVTYMENQLRTIIHESQQNSNTQKDNMV